MIMIIIINLYSNNKPFPFFSSRRKKILDCLSTFSLNLIRLKIKEGKALYIAVFTAYYLIICQVAFKNKISFLSKFRTKYLFSDNRPQICSLRDLRPSSFYYFDFHLGSWLDFNFISHFSFLSPV